MRLLLAENKHCLPDARRRGNWFYSLRKSPPRALHCDCFPFPRTRCCGCFSGSWDSATNWRSFVAEIIPVVMTGNNRLWKSPVIRSNVGAHCRTWVLHWNDGFAAAAAAGDNRGRPSRSLEYAEFGVPNHLPECSNKLVTMSISCTVFEILPRTSRPTWLTVLLLHFAYDNDGQNFFITSATNPKWVSE